MLPLVVALGAALASCCGSTATGEGLAIGDQAPDFDLPDVHGVKRRALSDHAEQVVLVNFWASWCMPCRMEMEELESLWNRYREQGFVVIAVSVDDDLRDAATFLDAVPVSFPVAWDDKGEVGDLYKVMNLPRSVLIDRQGRVRGRYEGYDSASFNAMSREIGGLLEETP